MKLGWPSRNEMLTSHCMFLFEICSVNLNVVISCRFSKFYFAALYWWISMRDQTAPTEAAASSPAHSVLSLCWVSPQSETSESERAAGRRGNKRPKTDLKHSNQSVIWPRAKSMLIISQSEQIGRWELARQVPRGPQGTWTVSSLH